MKKVSVLGLSLLFIVLLSLTAFGEGRQESEEQIQNSGIYEQFKTLDKQTKDFLTSLGLEGINADSVFNISFSSFFHSFIEAFKSGFSSVFRSFALLMAAILTGALSSSFYEGIKSGKNAEIFNLCCVLTAIVICLKPLSECVSSLSSAINGAAAFTLGVFPIICTVLAAQGKTITAVLLNGSSLMLSEVLSALSTQLFLPVSNVLLALGVAGGIDKSLQIDKLVGAVRKYLVIILSVCATVFFAVLGVKSSVSSSADGVSVKTIKVITSNFVPVIGNAISDSASAVVSSLSLTKSVVGGFGIIALIGIFLPVFCESFLWFGVLNISSWVAEVFALESLSKVLKNMSQAVLVMISILILSAIMFIINFGIALALKGIS